MTPIPAQIQSAREFLDLTINQAAELCGVSRATWYAWEAGKTDPPKKALERVADALKCSFYIEIGSNP